MRPLVQALCWYVVPGLVWVLASDAVAARLADDPAVLDWLQTGKGVAFVLVSGLVVYRLLATHRAAREVAEHAFSESERGFRLLFTNNPLPAWAFDRETLHFLEVNDVALATYGYGRDELLAMKVTDLHPPEELPALREAIATPRERRETSGIWHHRLRDGRLIEVEVQVHDLELRGRPARLVVALDITERQRALERERLRAARARALADAAIAINLARSLDELLQLAADTARTVLGAAAAVAVWRARRADGTVGRSLAWSTADGASASVLTLLQDDALQRLALEHGQTTRLSPRELAERAGTHRADEHTVRGWMAAPLLNSSGAAIGLIQVADRLEAAAGEGFSDEDEAVLIQLAQMTSVAADNARLNQDVLDRERRFRELVEGLDAIVWEADPATGRFTFVSQQAVTMLGYPAEAWRGEDGLPAACLTPEDRERVREYLGKVAAGQQPIPCEVRARAADGRRAWLRIEAAAHTDGAGTAPRLRGLISDVTGEHEEAERVAHGEKLRALGQLSSGAAHDLNQSLALIAGYGELLQHALDEHPLPMDRLHEMADVMVRAASDGGETVRRMLTFVHTSPEAAFALVDLSGVVHEVVRLTAPRWRDASQAEGHPIELTVEVEGEVVVKGSAASLREALTNLVLNAVDALPEGGTIQISAVARDDRAVVRVADNGIGMTDEVRARIFEPYFTTKGERGTGLGLPMVFGVVSAHAGEVTVRSELGRGTTFELTFPLAERLQTADATPRAELTAPSEGAAPGPSGLCCLVVDDEPQLARMLATILGRLGHQAVTASGGEEALAVLAREPVDVLLTDVGMGPSMNGWDLAARALEIRPGLPIILATGWGASIDAAEARARGVVGILAKPYRQANVRQVLADALAKQPAPPESRAS